MKQKGMVLLMVLAVLTLLCLLGLMFVLMANMERVTARAYLDMVRAKMIAQSGVHAAMVNTRVLLTEKGFDIKEMEYLGEDLNNDSTLTDGLVTENQDGDNTLQVLTCPLYRAVRPSFMVNRNGNKDAAGNDIFDEGDLIPVKDGSGFPKKVGVSGIMPGPYNQTIGAYYAVRVEDLSGKIFINGVEDSDTGLTGERVMLKGVLGNLAQEIFGKASIGHYLAAAAPFANLEEVRTKLAQPPYNTKFSEAEFTQLKSCLTTYAWRDTAVIKPVLLETRLRNENNAPVYPGDNVFTWRSIRPLMIGYPRNIDSSGAKRLVGRAPVNINTAPERVLIALLRGLGGVFLNESVGFEVQTSSAQFPKIWYSYNGSDPDVSRKGLLGRLDSTPEITREMARQIAKAIIQNRRPEMIPDATHPWRGPFRGWQQFNAFCNKVLCQTGPGDSLLPTDGQQILTVQQADVLKANFNPNSNLPEFNPPYQRLFWVGKDNLTGSTPTSVGGRSFEFSFFPTGYFLITSMGRIMGADNKVLAEAEIEAGVQLFNLYRETSQKDFLEDFWTKRSQITEIIKPHTDFGATYQYTTDNLTLQTYPEILEYDSYQPASPSGGSGYCRGPDLNQSLNLRNPYVQDAHYDGYITLATVENRVTDYAFRASFSYHKDKTNNLNADKPVNLACQADAFGPYQNRLIGPDNLTSAECEILQGFASGKPGAGTLFPDGVYSELDCVPIYDYQPPDFDNFTVSMWLKPHFFPESSAKTRVYLTYQVWNQSAYGPTAPLGIYNIANRDYSMGVIPSMIEKPPGSHIFIKDEDCSFGGYGGANYMPWDHTAFMAGGYHMPATNVDGSGQGTPCLNHISCGDAKGYHAGYRRDGEDWGMTLFRAGKWMHVVWAHRVGENLFCVNRKECNGKPFRCEGVASSRSKPVFTGPIRLGERRSAVGLNSVPDATLDEVLIWENASDDAYVTARDGTWQPGRYYRGNDGSFTSRAIDLCQQVRLPTGTPMTVFMVNWTQYVPEEKWNNMGVCLPFPAPGSYTKPPTCDIDILNAENKAKIGRRIKERTEPEEPPDPSGELVEDTYTSSKLVVTEPIRYRVIFKPNLPDPINDILVDPLIFDDITIIYYSVPKFLSWAYRR